MKLSFVIPAYNEEAYIGKCLESVLREIADARADAEIIVVNNASRDRTRAVALSFPGVRLVDEPRKGLSQARQSGFIAARGELIANIDADTRLPAGWVQRVIAAFTADRNLVGLSGPHVFYDLGAWANLWVRWCYYVVFANYLFIRFVSRVSSMLQGGNFIVRRQALEKIGGFNPDFAFYGEDADIARRLHKVGNVVFTFDLPIYASGRRLAAEGRLKMAWRYGLNYVWTVFFGRPFHTSFIDVRSQEDIAREQISRRRRFLLEFSMTLAVVFSVFCGGLVFLAHPPEAAANSKIVLRMQSEEERARLKLKGFYTRIVLDSD